MSLGYVRAARPDEAAEIARIQLSTWRTAYRRLLPRRVLDNLDEAWMTREWQEAINEPPSRRHRVLVAIEQPQTDQAQTDQAQTDQIRADQIRADQIRADQARADQTPTDQTQTDQTEADQTETDQTLADHDGLQIVGFAASGPADEAALAPDEEPLDDRTAAITDLLVEPRWGRRGHGSRLLAATVDLWRADGFERAVAWSYESDPATRSFLTSTGWEPDGTTRALDVDDLLVPQLRMHAALIEQ